MKINFSKDLPKFRPFTITIETEDDTEMLRRILLCYHQQNYLSNENSTANYCDQAKILLEDLFGIILK